MNLLIAIIICALGEIVRTLHKNTSWLKKIKYPVIEDNGELKYYPICNIFMVLYMFALLPLIFNSNNISIGMAAGIICIIGIIRYVGVKIPAILDYTICPLMILIMLNLLK